MTIVQSLWIGDEGLGQLQRLSIQSFLAHGHQYHLYAYDDMAVPRGTILCDASSVVPKDRVFVYREGFGKGSVSAFSNLFRYQLIKDKGGWWADTDVVCLRPFDFADEFVFACEREDDGTMLTATCVFKSPSESEYLDYCLDVCETKDKDALRWSEIGPYLFDEAVRRFGLGGHRVPAHVFNPVDYGDFLDMIMPGFDPSRIAESHAVHLWNQMWKSHDRVPAHEADPASLYAALRARYLGADVPAC